MIAVGVYRFQDWQKLLELKNPSCKEKQELAFKIDRPRIPLDGSEVISWVTKTERNWYHPEMYFMAVMDCDEQIQKVIGDNKYGKVIVNAKMTANNDHFSYEKQGEMKTDLVLMGCFIVLFYFNCIDLSKHSRMHETKNTPHMYCIFAMSFNALAIVCNLFHNVQYSRDGEGIVVLDVFGTIFDMVSECIVTLVVLMMANGWYTRFQKFDWDDALETYGPLWVLVIMIHICFGAFSYIDNDAYHKYHDYHGWVGYCLIVAKLVLVLVFLYYYSYTKEVLRNEALKFYKQFVPIGVLYLLSDPLIILTSFLWEEYNRQFFYRLID